jgi:hypothetical protein
MALDEISLWRPNWDNFAWSKIYYGGIANKEVRDPCHGSSEGPTISYG